MGLGLVGVVADGEVLVEVEVEVVGLGLVA